MSDKDVWIRNWKANWWFFMHYGWWIILGLMVLGVVVIYLQERKK